MLYFVSVYYSWTSEHPLYAFATKDEAIEFMRHDYDNEYIQATNPDNELIARGSISDSYAIFQFYSGEYIEWFVTNLSNELPLVPNCSTSWFCRCTFFSMFPTSQSRMALMLCCG